VRFAPYSYRDDVSVPAFPDDQPLLVFDGDCALCSASVRFVLDRDRARRFRFASAQSPLGRALLTHYRLDPEAPASNILLHRGRAHFKSAAVLRSADLLGWPWSLAAAGRVIPRPLRDLIYDVVARTRRHWLRRSPSCFLPSGLETNRFLR
jgi:predicted DCC family thiol-disulfide oxidoreductase YuxK